MSQSEGVSFPFFRDTGLTPPPALCGQLLHSKARILTAVGGGSAESREELQPAAGQQIVMHREARHERRTGSQSDLFHRT